ncbi:MAG: glycosyltransferase family A protein [Acidobacteriota bacterium]
MKVGVVIPAHNAECFIAGTLASLQRQSYPNWQAVVVDDGSHDRTAELVRQAAAGDARLRLVAQENRGAAAARDRGFDELGSSCDGVLFFDHDDRLRPDALARLSATLSDSPNACAAYGLAATVDAGGRLIRRGKLGRQRCRRKLEGRRLVAMRVEEPMTFAGLVVRNWIPVGGILIRSEAKRAAGAFDAAIGHAHDWDMWLRLSLLAPIAFLNEVVYDYRVHATGMSHDPGEILRSELLVREKLVMQADLPVEIRRQALIATRLVLRAQLRRQVLKSAGLALRLRATEGRERLATARANFLRFAALDPCAPAASHDSPP